MFFSFCFWVGLKLQRCLVSMPLSPNRFFVLSLLTAIFCVLKVLHPVAFCSAFKSRVDRFCRTLSSFELWIKKGGKSTDYYLPTELLVMINVVLDYKNQVRWKKGKKILSRDCFRFLSNKFPWENGPETQFPIVCEWRSRWPARSVTWNGPCSELPPDLSHRNRTLSQAKLTLQFCLCRLSNCVH